MRSILRSPRERGVSGGREEGKGNNVNYGAPGVAKIKDCTIYRLDIMKHVKSAVRGAKGNALMSFVL